MSDLSHRLTSEVTPTASEAVGLVVTLLIVAGCAALWSVAARARGGGRESWRSAFAALAQRAMAAREGLLVGAALLAVHAWLMVAAQAGLIVSWRDGVAAMQPASLALETLAVPLAVSLAFLAAMRRRARRLGVPPPRPADVLAGLPRAGCAALVAYLAVIPLVLASAVVSRAALLALGLPVEPQGVVAFLLDDELPRWAAAHFIFLAVVVAPVFEELLFRGVLFPWLLRMLRPAAAVALCSVLFAAMHFHLPSALPLAMAGAGFALAYAWTGSLAAPILMHALFNAVNLALLLLMGGEADASGVGRLAAIFFI